MANAVGAVILETTMTDLTMKQKAGHFSALRREQHRRYYINLNITNDYNHATGKRQRNVWPILFKSRELAEKAMQCLPIFLNADYTDTRGKIKSASIEITTLPISPIRKIRA